MYILPFLISLLFSSIASANHDYVTDGDITQCESQSPSGEDDCKGYSNEDHACCYGKYTEGAKCFKIPRNYRFALDTISTYKDANGADYPDINFTCNQVSALCGTDSPSEIFQCREHSSKQNSCCYIKQGDITDCILADSKFPNQTINETLGDTLIVCESSYMNIFYMFYIIALIFIIEI